MRRALVAVLAAALAAAIAPSAQAAGLSLAETAGAQFPDRAFVLTLPAPRTLAAGDVSVRENGRSVPGVEVLAPGRSGGERFGVVLGIDNSYSMRGRPLRAAVRAARTFVAHRATGQPIAVIVFAGQVRTVVPFTTDAGAIGRGLDSIAPAGGGSRIIDGAERAVAMLRAAHAASGSAVILSDGGDHRSRATLPQVAAAANAAGVRVFSVGLRSGNDNFGTLNLLAAGAKGEFSAASSLDDLARIYDRLGAQLSHQYVVRYHSAAGPGRRVDVTASVKGVAGVARATYTTPALAHASRPPFHHAPLESFWTTPGATLLIALLVAALCAVGLWVLLRPAGGTVRERMAAYVRASEEGEDGREGGGLLGDRLLRGAERSLEGRAWWATFKERMDVGQIEMPPARLLAWVGAGTVLVLVAAPLLGGNPAFAAVALVVPFAAKAVVDRRAAKQRKLFGDQLPDNLQVIASAMRAGHSFGGALSVVVDDAQEPTRRELRRVIADERLGVPLETALGTVVRRMESKDLEQVALVASLQRETGGNTAEVLDRVTETVRERMTLQRMVNTLTAQGRMSRWVLTALPCVLLAVITVVNPTYVQPLYTTTPGRILLGLAAGMVCAGSFVIKRIVNIKV